MIVVDILIKIIKGVIADFVVPKNISIDDNKTTIKLGLVNIEKPVEVRNNLILINPDTREGKLICEEIFNNYEHLLCSGQRIIEGEFSELISEAKKYINDSSSDDQVFLKAIKVFVPQADIAIIQAALFIRRIYRGHSDVHRFKDLLIQRYGSRGNNISNLITAGYYESYLLPIYEHLQKTEGVNAHQIFNEIYEEAVTQYPFAVFVPAVKTYEQIKGMVSQKIRLNLMNDQHMMNIHGIGERNKKTITKLLDDKDIARFYQSEPDVVVFEKIVYARIYF
jgi:hypothetical protein